MKTAERNVVRLAVVQHLRSTFAIKTKNWNKCKSNRSIPGNSVRKNGHFEHYINCLTLLNLFLCGLRFHCFSCAHFCNHTFPSYLLTLHCVMICLANHLRLFHTKSCPNSCLGYTRVRNWYSFGTLFSLFFWGAKKQRNIFICFKSVITVAYFSVLKLVNSKDRVFGAEPAKPTHASCHRAMTFQVVGKHQSNY